MTHSGSSLICLARAARVGGLRAAVLGRPQRRPVCFNSAPHRAPRAPAQVMVGIQLPALSAAGCGVTTSPTCWYNYASWNTNLAMVAAQVTALKMYPNILFWMARRPLRAPTHPPARAALTPYRTRARADWQRNQPRRGAQHAGLAADVAVRGRRGCGGERDRRWESPDRDGYARRADSAPRQRGCYAATESPRRGAGYNDASRHGASQASARMSSTRSTPTSRWRTRPTRRRRWTCWAPTCTATPAWRSRPPCARARRARRGRAARLRPAIPRTRGPSRRARSRWPLQSHLFRTPPRSVLS